MFVTVDDVKAILPEADEGLVAALIEHAEALALAAAPCLGEPGFTGGAALKAILVGAVSRWVTAGDGTATTMQAGPFSQTVDATSKRLLFWPTELKALRGLCGGSRGRVFHVSMMP